MIGNQTMDYYVRPRHLYSHCRTCTRSGLCRILSILVASLICYLLDHASVHEISALMTWYQYMSNISSHYGYLDLVYIFSHFGDHDPLYIVYLHHGDSDLCILYVAMTTYVIFCITPIHGHCTLMYPGLLYVLVVICRVVLLYYDDSVAGLPFGILHHSTYGMDL